MNRRFELGENVYKRQGLEGQDWRLKRKMNDGFYKAFEERFRGSRPAVKQGFSVYLPFVEPFHGGAALDLGCGRGEWLDVLRENGFDARGIDLDDDLLAVCRDAGLLVEKGDALISLQRQADQSLTLVSAIHVAEHLPFDQLRLLITEALRVLIPGGLLILETPNPENIQVATTHFYRDPTHQRPLPPELLSFLPEHAGFARVKVLRCAEPEHIMDESQAMTLEKVLKSVSPDYAVVAQKAASSDVLAQFDKAFAKEYGVPPEILLRRFEKRLAQMESELHRAGARLQDTEGFVNKLRNGLPGRIIRRLTGWKKRTI